MYGGQNAIITLVKLWLLNFILLWQDKQMKRRCFFGYGTGSGDIATAGKDF